MSKQNCFTSLGVLFFFLFFLLAGRALGEQASFWPNLICQAGILLSALSAVLALIKMRTEEKKLPLFPLSFPQMKRCMVVLCGLVLWIVCMAKIGYLVSMTVVSVGLILYFEPHQNKKNMVRDIVVAVVFSGLIYGLFYLLGIRFPSGLLI